MDDAVLTAGFVFFGIAVRLLKLRRGRPRCTTR